MPRVGIQCLKTYFDFILQVTGMSELDPENRLTWFYRREIFKDGYNRKDLPSWRRSLKYWAGGDIGNYILALKVPRAR